jgi:hypothetical protein
MDFGQPQQASLLAPRFLAEELEKRHMKVSGFFDDDARRLQVVFNAEFEAEKAEMMVQLAAVEAAKKDREAALRSRQHEEAQRVAEEGALAGDARAAALAALVRSGARAPAALELRGLGAAAQRALLRALARAPAGCRVAELDLACCGLRDADCAAALRALLAADPPALRVLRLEENALTAHGAAMLAAGLRRNTRLLALSLGGNQLAAPGAGASPGEEVAEENGEAGQGERGRAKRAPKASGASVSEAATGN